MQAEAAPLDCTPQQAGRLRREPRAPVVLTCQLRLDSTGWRPASMVDLSRAGFRLAWLPKCMIGRQIWVRMPGFEAMPAMVRWRDQRGVGCEFLRPLHAAVIEHLCRFGKSRSS